MDERNIQKQCKLNYQEQMQQQIIINGIPQGGQIIKIPYLTCPSCGNVIAQFDAGASLSAIAAACDQQLKNNINYCAKCGQKLDYPTIVEIPASDIEEVTDD